MASGNDDADTATVPVTPRPARDARAQTQPVAGTDELVVDSRVGRYRLVERLGSGAMGVVWSAFDPQLDRKVAIKVVHPALAKAPDASTRLLREARAMAKLSHRSVITVHDAGEADGQLFIAMELVAGTTLGALLRGRGATALADWARWLTLIVEAGKGLAAAHRAGVLHRDFKPDNVLVDASGRVCVGDFGLATLGGDQQRAELSQRWSNDAVMDLTMTGALLGTPGYMSPQQLRGDPVDARGDQFSFCVTAWEALYGARPFVVKEQGLDAIPALAEAIEARQLPPPPAGSTVPPEVRAVLVRGLSPATAERWPDMDAVVDALEIFVKTPSVQSIPGTPVPGTPASLPGSIAAPPRSDRKLYVVMGLVALGIAAAVAIAIVVIGSRREARAPAAASPSVKSVIAKPLFGIAVKTTIGLAPDGNRLALAGEALEVRSLDGKQLWMTPTPVGFDIVHVELDDKLVRFGTKSGRSIHRWRYQETEQIEVEREVGGRWFGRTASGDIVYTQEAQPRPAGLWLVDGAEERQHRKTSAHVEVLAISPDRKRVAYVEPDRFVGRIVVWNVVDDTAITSKTFTAPTALAWLDDQTLLFATGTQQLPTIHRIAISTSGFAQEVPLYSLEQGWFGEIVATGEPGKRRVFVTQMKVQSRARSIERNGATRDFDPSGVGAAFAWVSSTEFLAWNRSSGRVQRRTLKDQGLQTPYLLDGEPANATRADGTLIVAIRRPDGREVVAFGSDGAVLWRHDDLQTLAVRCAGDAKPPCFAVRSGKPDSVVTLDPRTGERGEQPVFEGSVEDIAVRDDGKELIISRPMKSLLLLDPTTRQLAGEQPLPLPSTRSVAYDPQGGFLVGSTRVRSKYQVGRFFEGQYTVMTETDNDILSIVRPSPDGAQILVHLRVYSPEIYELTLPTE